MPYPHAIRLRGPWKYEVLARSRGAARSQQGSLGLPADWGEILGADFCGRVRFRRGFHAPANLAAAERVWLACEGADAAAQVALNGREVGGIAGYARLAEFDITPNLAPRNELTIDVDLPALDADEQARRRPGREGLAGGLIGDVRLEIRLGVFPADLGWRIVRVGSTHRFECAGRLAAEPNAAATELLVASAGREWLRIPLSRKGDFSYSAPLPDYRGAVFAPDRRPAALTDIAFELHADGIAIWERKFQATAQDLDWDAERGVLAIAGHEMPRERVWRLPPGDYDRGTLAQWISEAPGAWCECTSVLSGELYSVCDRMRMAVIQTMPLDWSADVARRLACHASIVAWRVPVRESPPANPIWGRPWLAAEGGG